MSLVYSGIEPQPSLAWQFQSSNVDSVTGLTPSAQVSPGPAQLQGSAALVTNAPTSNTAVSFPGGSGDYMNLGTASPANFDCTTSNLFCEMWVYRSATGQHFIINNMNSSNKSYAVYFRSDSKIEIDTQSRSAVSVSTVGAGVWTHVAFSIVVPVTSNGIRIFINGNLDTTSGNATTETYDATRSVYIGYYIGSPGTMTGYIRDLRVVQGGVVPVATFTPGAAPFSYASPGYVANMGTTVFTLLGQFVTYNPSGKYNTSLVMGGQTRYVYTPPSSIDLGTSGATISLWLKSLASTYNYFLSIVGMGGNGNTYINRFYVYIQNNTSKIIASFIDNTSTALTLTSTTSLAVGTWTHMCFTLQNGVMTIYINGTNEASRSDAPMSGVTLDSALTIAARPQSPGTVFMNAEYDDLRIYNTALTATQVQSVYSSQGAPAPSRAMPLPKLAWDFNGTTTDYVKGVSGSVGGVISYETGKYGNSLNIKNPSGTTSNSVNFNFSASYSIDLGFSECFWFKCNDLSYLTSIQIASITYSGFNNAFRFQINTGGSLQFQFQDSVGNKNINMFGPTVGIWYHLAAVAFNGIVAIYVNGAYYAQTAYVQSGITFDNMSLGLATTFAGYPLTNGSYDDLRIFDRALTSAQVQSIYNQQGMPGRGAVTSNSRQIYVAPTGTYPSYTPTSGAQFPVFNTSNVSFYSSGGTSGGTVGRYLAFGSQTFNMSSGFSAVCQFAWTNGIGVWERIFDFGIGTNNNNILLTRTGTSTNLFFSYRIGGTEYFVTATGAISAQNTLYTVVAIYDPSKPLLSLYVNGNLTTSVPAVVARDTRTLTRTYVGRSNWAADAYSNVNINYLSVYNRVLTPDEITTPLPTPQITLKGTPLFSQLSSGATNSAVGAFSLRAVNGTSARAVQVRPQGHFPPAAMTSAATQLTNQFTQTLTGYPFGGAGSYTANCSSFYPSLFPWKAFDRQTGPNKWASGAGEDYSAGVATTNTQTTGGYNGAWLQIQVPAAINLFSYSITASPNLGKMPSKWYILGSNDGSSWTLVDSQQTGVSWSGGEVKTLTPTPTIAYLYYRMVINQINDSTAGGNLAEIGEWILYGAPPNTATDFYADRLGNLLTAPVVGQSLANWLGGATGYVTTWYDQSGAGNDAIQNTAANQPIIQRATKGPGYMVNFNGTSQFVTLSASYNFLNGTNLIVNAVALRTATKAGANFIFGTNSASVNYQRIAIGFESDTTLDPLGNLTNSPGITIPAYSSGEQVYYMTGVLSPSRVVYNNDVVGGTNPDTVLLSVPVGTQFSIGSTSAGGAVYYNGNLFELLIFTSALNQTQVTQIYNNQLSAYGT